MKKIASLLLLIVFFNCKEKNVDLMQLNGYWEIEEVQLPDGSLRDYTYNNTIDYIELTDSVNGIREKLKPKIDGDFEGSNLKESFEVRKENDSLNLYYKTPYSHWKETILMLNEEHLKVINQNQIIYTYKHYQPLILD